MNKKIAELIKKYQAMINPECHVCGEIKKAIWMECGCMQDAENKVLEQVIEDLKKLK